MPRTGAAFLLFAIALVSLLASCGQRYPSFHELSYCRQQSRALARQLATCRKQMAETELRQPRVDARRGGQQGRAVSRRETEDVCRACCSCSSWC